MEALPRNVWKRISRNFPAEGNDAALAAEWFREYESAGFLNRPTAEILRAGLPVAADFFRRASLMYSSESPVLRRRDTRWMGEFDYTLMNVRAAGISGQSGNFLSAAFFLTVLRTRAVILAPVTKGSSFNLSHLESHAVLRPELTHPEAAAAGIGPEIQMAAFCEAAHLLGFALGFELDYRVDPLAAVVVNRPELFFWTENDVFTGDEAVQDELRARVAARVSSVRKAGAAMSREILGSALDVSSLAALPAEDGTARTPLALRMVSSGEPGEHRDQAVSYWGRVFDLWRDRYGFDFLVLRGTGAGKSEAPDRSLVRKAAEHARKAGVRRNIGVAADGNGFEVESFGVQGADLVLEQDALARADYDWFRRTFDLDETLKYVNLGRKLRFSVPVTVDPGPKESRPARERALLKRFTARFLGAGPTRRPLVETMGALEGAWGYKAALEADTVMGWMPDASAARTGRLLEDTVREHRTMLESAERVDGDLNERKAWWVLKCRRGLLIPVVSVENGDLLPPDQFRIDYADYVKDPGGMTVLEYDFRDARGLLQLGFDTIIEVTDVPYRGFRLYVVT